MADTPTQARDVKNRRAPRGSTAEEVRSHYDLSNDFFRLWQDPTQTYSCAYFERDDMSLQEAQIAKIDLSLGKLGLQPGMTLLDIGCGWGSTVMRAIEKYDVNVIGLTLSHNQKAHIECRFAAWDSPRSKRVLLMPWEEFDEPVDRIVSIGAFEHFGFEKYDFYFKKTYDLLPDEGRMLLHTIVSTSKEEVAEFDLPTTMSLLRFFKFIHRDLSGWPHSADRSRREQRDAGRLHCKPEAAAAAALRAHTGYLGGEPTVQEGRGHRHHQRGSLRPLHEVPDRLRRAVPRRLHRRLPIHLRKGLTRAAAEPSLFPQPRSWGRAHGYKDSAIRANAPTFRGCAGPLRPV